MEKELKAIIEELREEADYHTERNYYSIAEKLWELGDRLEALLPKPPVRQVDKYNGIDAEPYIIPRSVRCRICGEEFDEISIFHPWVHVLLIRKFRNFTKKFSK